MLSEITLKKGKERSVLNFHPWIFSGAIDKVKGSPKDGDLVRLLDSSGSLLGQGMFNNGSISLRLLTFSDEVIDANFWKQRIQKAYQVRERLGLINNPQTTIYRLVHGEGDNLSGLIVDIYGDTAVMQCHNAGIYKVRAHIVEGLKAVYGNALTCIYDKSGETMPSDGNVYENEFLLGNRESTVALENGHKFNINWMTGQKTGFFVDQRENRELLAKYSVGKKVLNTFCYSGGFSVYALETESKLVHSVDSSQKAIDLTEQNVTYTQKADKHESFAMDTFSFFKTAKEKYDVIVLDPPAFAKHLKALKNAAQGYQRLNRTAFEQIAPGGILFTFSCSQVVDRSLFRKVVFAAAAQAKRNVRILHQVSQPADHPINIYHPEGEYLKGLVLFVE